MPSLKAALRDQFKAYRQGLDADAYAARSAAIVARVQALPEVARAETIHAYWPLVARREIDTRPLIEALHARGKRLVCPVMVTLDAAAPPRLRHVRFAGAAGLRRNRWGIDEPTGGETVPLEEIDVVLVPALGADRRGHRLGYGGGFYDTFLAVIKAPTVGLVYDACLVDALPAEPHDVPLTVMVTETTVLRPVVTS